MSWFRRCRDQAEASTERAAPAEDAEHAVIVHVPLSDDEFGQPHERESLLAVEHRVAGAIASAGVGEHDGHEFGGGEFVIYSYGPSADRLWEVIEGVLRRAKLAEGTWVYKRHGDVNSDEAPEERFEVSP